MRGVSGMDKSEVLDFIKRRFSIYETDGWRTGNCYWFAEILCDRFPGLEIYYLPAQGHFMAGDPIANQYWDIDGLHTYESLPERPISLYDIQTKDLTWYMRLLRDCKM